MTKLLLGLFSGFLFVEKIRGVSYFLIARDLALLLGWGMLIIFLLSLAIGTISGWLLAKRQKLSLLQIKKKDRVMVIAPHPDDEVLAAGGLLAYLFRKKAQVKIVYLTCGDGNASLFWRDRKVKFSPAKFIQTGRERKQEAEKAIKILGGSSKNLVFLGYPDSCLWQMWSKLKVVVASPTTELDHSSYDFTFRERRDYKGENVIEDLTELIKKFKPTIIISPHLKESHPDHRASCLFARKAIKESNWSGRHYYYLVHYKRAGLFRVYPPKRKPGESEKILYPPYPLWRDNKWFSFWLRPEQLKKKKLALQEHKSQKIVPTLNQLFKSFLTQNEIFQLVDCSYASSRR